MAVRQGATILPVQPVFRPRLPSTMPSILPVIEPALRPPPDILPPIAPPRPGIRPVPTEVLRAQAQAIDRELGRRQLPPDEQFRQDAVTMRAEKQRAQQAAMQELIRSGTVSAREIQTAVHQQRAAAVRNGQDPRVLEAEMVIMARQRQAELQSRRLNQEFQTKVIGIKRRHAEEREAFGRAMVRHREVISALQGKVRQLQMRIAQLEDAKLRARNLAMKAQLEQSLENARIEYKRSIGERQELLRRVEGQRRRFIQDAQNLQRQLRLEQVELQRQRKQIDLARKGVHVERSPVPFRAPALTDVWKDVRASLNIGGDPVEVGVQDDVGGFQIGSVEDADVMEVMDVAGGENSLTGRVLGRADEDEELAEFESYDDVDDDIVRL